MILNPHVLPVLLMFLKLPKLFNFHILRLAAEREIRTGEGKEKQRDGRLSCQESFKRVTEIFDHPFLD